MVKLTSKSSSLTATDEEIKISTLRHVERQVKIKIIIKNHEETGAGKTCILTSNRHEEAVVSL